MVLVLVYYTSSRYLSDKSLSTVEDISVVDLPILVSSCTPVLASHIPTHSNNQVIRSLLVSMPTTNHSSSAITGNSLLSDINGLITLITAVIAGAIARFSII
jgi:hypothetical protein